MERVTVMRAPQIMWYSSKLGVSYEVVSYDQSYEAYLVKTPNGDRYIYKCDCEDIDIKTDLTFHEEAFLMFLKMRNSEIKRISVTGSDGLTFTLTDKMMPALKHELKQVFSEAVEKYSSLIK
jgi:hypothetical protein